MNNQTKPQKPLALLYNEARDIIYTAISTAARLIPFYMIEEILTNYLAQVMKQSQNEIDEAARVYEQQLAEYEEAEKETEKEAESEGES